MADRSPALLGQPVRGCRRSRRGVRDEPSDWTGHLPEEQSINYFVGKLVKLDDFGIWYEHPASKCMTFIFYDKILSIAEEQVIAEEEEKSQNITEQVNVARIEEPKTINIPQKIDVVVGAEHLQDKTIDLPDSVDEFREFISSS